jgi:hypothetical protein
VARIELAPLGWRPSTGKTMALLTGSSDSSSSLTQSIVLDYFCIWSGVACPVSTGWFREFERNRVPTSNDYYINEWLSHVSRGLLHSAFVQAHAKVPQLVRSWLRGSRIGRTRMCASSMTAIDEQFHRLTHSSATHNETWQNLGSLSGMIMQVGIRIRNVIARSPHLHLTHLSGLVQKGLLRSLNSNNNLTKHSNTTYRTEHCHSNSLESRKSIAKSNPELAHHQRRPLTSRNMSGSAYVVMPVGVGKDGTNASRQETAKSECEAMPNPDGC